MHAMFLLVLTHGGACQVPHLAEIVEGAEGAARISVAENTLCRETSIAGRLLAGSVEETLWGDPPPAITVWKAAGPFPCDHDFKVPELVVGYRIPTPAQREHLRLPAGVLLLCGAAVPRSGLCGELRRLRNADNADELLALMAERDPEIREQAFRQLRISFLSTASPGLLARLLPLAETETDPDLTRSYLSTFGHFGYGEAGPLAVHTILTTPSEAASSEAERAFQALAEPETIARLISEYHGARLPVKGRILRALAPIAEPESEKLLAAALEEEETVLPALEALAGAGRTAPSKEIRVRDPVRAHRVKALIRRAGPRLQVHVVSPEED